MRRHPYRIVALIVFAAVTAVLAAACLPAPVPPPTVTPRATLGPTATAEPTETLVPGATPRPPKPTATLPAFVAPPEDDECSACKREPEPYNPGPVGKQQPPGHKGRTACLSCHKSLPQPALPATHASLGDEACAMCHATPPKASGPVWNGQAALVRVHL